MCTILLPAGVNTIAVNKYIISRHIKCVDTATLPEKSDILKCKIHSPSPSFVFPPILMAGDTIKENGIIRNCILYYRPMDRIKIEKCLEA